ncbi:MAG: DUF479 domain-containing protein [Gammaproteobacteria bacterium]|nr:DUF479 domain-containing protein [Gammaproteobacteria bacterium]
MNFLAHLLLSGSDPDWRTGGYLGDFIRGPLTGERPAAIERGIALHRHVDATSDRHAAVREAARLFEGPCRRWAPVALDVLFDHFLARDFPQWSQQPLTTFSGECYQQLDARRAHLTDPARRFLDRMADVDLLAAYANRSSVPRALTHIASRARRSNPLAQMDAILTDLEPELHAAFERLMPALLASTRARIAAAIDESYRPSG